MFKTTEKYVTNRFEHQVGRATPLSNTEQFDQIVGDSIKSYKQEKANNPSSHFCF